MMAPKSLFFNLNPKNFFCAHMRASVHACFCKEALASRDCMKHKIPAGFIVDWAVVEGGLGL